ncbi:hypothetical protein CMK22_05755 [Candidatus Poribacteria bacterium]|nr:hypothetical protein [Candidatus Poribacteria bacterium]
MLVPVADAIERQGKALDDKTNMSFESQLVRKIKTQCNDLDSYQGVFVATPSGLLLAGTHHDARDTREVKKLLQEGLKKWKTISPVGRFMTKEMFSKAVEELAKEESSKWYPADGLVLSVICRDLPRPDAKNVSQVHRNMYNLDYAWFGQSEARAFLPGQLIKGAKRKVKRDLVERLARFHFVDLVRGHTYSPFPQKAVEQADLTAEVIDVSYNLVSLGYNGRTRTSEVHEGVHIEGKWNPPGPGIPKLQKRGVDAKLKGHAVYDQKAKKFVSFNLLVVTKRWGGNVYNARAQFLDFGPAPMGIVLRLAGDSMAERVPPFFFRSYGWK